MVPKVSVVQGAKSLLATNIRVAKPGHPTTRHLQPLTFHLALTGGLTFINQHRLSSVTSTCHPHLALATCHLTLYAGQSLLLSEPLRKKMKF